jgi:hypothetical protein
MSGEKKTQAASLLAGILEETESEAARERERLDRELQEREQAERERRAAEEAQRQAELRRQLDAEAQRQDDARARRLAAMEALRIEELKEKGLWTEPEPEPAPVAAPSETRPVQHTAEVVAAQKRSARPMQLALAAAILAVGGGVALFAVFGQVPAADSESRYAYAAPVTVEAPTALATIGFQPIPDPIVREAEPEPEPAARSGRSSRGSSGRTTTNERRPPRIQLGGELRGP